MKIKNGFELRNVCGENVIIAHGVENDGYARRRAGRVLPAREGEVAQSIRPTIGKLWA